MTIEQSSRSIWKICLEVRLKRGNLCIDKNVPDEWNCRRGHRRDVATWMSDVQIGVGDRRSTNRWFLSDENSRSIWFDYLKLFVLVAWIVTSIVAFDVQNTETTLTLETSVRESPMCQVVSAHLQDKKSTQRVELYFYQRNRWQIEQEVGTLKIFGTNRCPKCFRTCWTRSANR